MKFKASHRPYRSKYTNAYKIHPDNCLQWLNTSVKNRVSALDKSKAQQLCHICLSIPVSWNRPGMGCDGAHALRRKPTDRYASQLCVVPECPYHYTVCYTHIEQNKAHPLIGFPNKWLATIQASNPTMNSLSKETIMLLPDPDPLVPLACPLNPQAQTVTSRSNIISTTGISRVYILHGSIEEHTKNP